MSDVQCVHISFSLLQAVIRGKSTEFVALGAAEKALLVALRLAKANVHEALCDNVDTVFFPISLCLSLCFFHVYFVGLSIL